MKTLYSSSPLPVIKPLLQALQGKNLEVPPVWLMRQAGRYLPEYRSVRQQAGSFWNLCFNPQLASEVTLQPIRRFGFDGAIIFSDILTIPYALGQHVEFREGEGPHLEELSISGLKLEGMVDRLGKVYEALSLTKSQLPSEVTLLGFAGAPWTVATYMIEGKSSKNFLKTLRFAYTQPHEFQSLLDLLCQAIIEHLSAQIQAGAEAVQLFDSWAGAVPGNKVDEWIIEPTRKIINALKERYPQVPVIGFPKGLGIHSIHYAQEIAVDVVGCDTSLSAQWVAKNLHPLRVIQGLLDPALLVAGGDVLRTTILDMKKTLGKRPYIFNLGHGIVPETPLEHVADMLRWVREG